MFKSHLRIVPVTAFVVAALCLCLHFYYGRAKFFRRHFVPVLDDHLARGDLRLATCLYWCVTAWLIYVLVPHFSMKAAYRYAPPEDRPQPSFGWGLGDWRVGVSACVLFMAVMFPILGVIVWNGEFQGKYPLCDAATLSLRNFVIYEIGLALYFVAWEYFFRGFLTFSLEKTLGFWVVFVQMLPFVVAHFEKPDLESLSSIVGGIALGWLALRTRSFWYGAFIHAATDFTLDVMMVTVKGGLG